MTAKITKVLNAPGIASDYILKAVSKIAPGIGPFITGAGAAGFVSDQIVDFLRNKYLSKEERRNKARLEERSTEGTARPDERAELARMEQRGGPAEALSTISKVGSRVVGGLSQIKHASDLQKSAQSESAASTKEASPTEVPATDSTPRDKVLKAAPEQVPQEQQQIPSQSKQAPNAGESVERIIAQFPELGRFIDQQMSSGKSPRESALLARQRKLFLPIINQIESRAGIAFPDIVEKIFTDQKGQGHSQKGPDPIEQSLIELIQKIKGK